MQNNRTLAFSIYKILCKYSDENHPLTSKQILKYLELEECIKISRTTLYHYIQSFQEYGIDVVNSDNINDGKYLIDRQFEKSQVFLLSNAIQSSHFIPYSASKELINKLLITQSIYFQKDYSLLKTIHIRKKCPNKSFFYNIELILEAINLKCAISFQYLHYNTQKKMVSKDHKNHIVFPVHIVTENGNTYLICFHQHHKDKVIHYRIDKISNINILKELTDIKLNRNFDPYLYTSTMPFMFAGDPMRIIMRCHIKILDDLIDLFGNEIFITPNKDSNFVDVKVLSSKQGIIYFALQYLKFCEILEPIEIREELKNILNENIKKYL